MHRSAAPLKHSFLFFLCLLVISFLQSSVGSLLNHVNVSVDDALNSQSACIERDT